MTVGGAVAAVAVAGGSSSSSSSCRSESRDGMMTRRSSSSSFRHPLGTTVSALRGCKYHEAYRVDLSPKANKTPRSN